VQIVTRNPRTRASQLLIMGLTALSAAAIAGCGGDDEATTVATTGPTGPTGATGAAGQAQELDVSEIDYELDPADPTVKPGEITVKATNDGQVVHSLVVEAPDGDVQLSQDLQPGDAGELKVNLDKAGKYKWYCPIANHEELGMVGDITVEE